MVKELYDGLTECCQTLAGLVEDAEHMGFDGYADVCIMTESEGAQSDGTFVDVTLKRTATDGSKCANCEYFYPMRSVPEADRGMEASEGECRRYPPVPDRENGCIGDWPTVQTYDWCGEHRAGSYRDAGFQ